MFLHKKAGTWNEWLSATFSHLAAIEQGYQIQRRNDIIKKKTKIHPRWQVLIHTDLQFLDPVLQYIHFSVFKIVPDLGSYN